MQLSKLSRRFVRSKSDFPSSPFRSSAQCFVLFLFSLCTVLCVYCIVCVLYCLCVVLFVCCSVVLFVCVYCLCVCIVYCVCVLYIVCVWMSVEGGSYACLIMV